MRFHVFFTVVTEVWLQTLSAMGKPIAALESRTSEHKFGTFATELAEKVVLVLAARAGVIGVRMEHEVLQ